jgi:hypothetical protein
LGRSAGGTCRMRTGAASGGHLVSVSQFSRWLLPTLVTSRRGKGRTRDAPMLVLRAGLSSPRRHRLYALIINAVTATKPA